MQKSAPRAAPRLVVADDEEGLLFLMVDALRREGFQVEGFDSGASAFEYLCREPADLLLLDLKMGDLPAPKLIDQLRERGRTFPFIVITGHGDERTAVEIMKQGALDYVMKESGLLELLPAIVQRALDAIARERKVAEADAAVHEAKERLHRVIKAAMDGFVRFNAKGKILEVNAAFCKLLGKRSGTLIGSSVFEIHTTAPHEIPDLLKRLRAEGFVHAVTWLHRFDGKQLDVEISLHAEGDEFFGFFHDISEQRRLEREVLEIGEMERRRFGAELHDNLGQQLTALDLISTALARDLKRVAPALAKPAAEIAQSARQMIAQTRQLAHGLAPVALESDGLEAALADLAHTTSATGVDCQIKCAGGIEIPTLETATHLYRIAQEAISNALKHAKSTKIVMRLDDHDGDIGLSIQDNGRGLPSNYKEKHGMGLRAMQHRARLIGAQLTVQGETGKGVRITCSIPK